MAAVAVKYELVVNDLAIKTSWLELKGGMRLPDTDKQMTTYLLNVAQAPIGSNAQTTQRHIIRTIAEQQTIVFTE